MMIFQLLPKKIILLRTPSSYDNKLKFFTNSTDILVFFTAETPSTNFQRKGPEQGTLLYLLFGGSISNDGLNVGKKPRPCKADGARRTQNL